MIYVNMYSRAACERNFKIYRVVRLLHDLRVIKDDELIFHEERIYMTKLAGLHVDWKNYRLYSTLNGEYIQF